jgi:hypothetical protein
MLKLKANKPRAFNYKYKVYKPDTDEDKPRIDFHSDSDRRFDGKGSIVKLVFLLLFLVYFFFSLQKALNQAPGNTNAGSDVITVEEVIVVD